MNRGIYGNEFDKLIERNEAKSTLSRMQQQYWETKQQIIRKLKKKEDDCIVNSDFQLDTKLELFRSIAETCSNLILILEGYQDRLCMLSHEENALGRFLKECGKMDKTRAGKMMTSSGKTMSYTAQQRIQLRSPLVRLYQEVETFQYRAITDTLSTIEKMEKSRNAYRAALLWMKDISQVLDPDTYKKLEKFRKVQAHTRRTKTRFDKLKIDTQQKIDMLAVSRCNMLSHALVSYQNGLVTFWEKTSKTMNNISECFKGYQYYEFNMLKELTETSKKLSLDGSEGDESKSLLRSMDNEDDQDRLLYFESEYHDEPKKGDERKFEKTDGNQISSIPKRTNPNEIMARKQEVESILSANLDQNDLDILHDIFSSTQEENLVSFDNDPKATDDLFLPSQLMAFNINDPFKNTNEVKKPESKDSKKPSESKWFDLFSELDPLANPDAIGKFSGDEKL